jgi:hypothetical protein
VVQIVEWKEEKTGHNQFVLVGMLGRPNHVRPNVTVCCWLLFTWRLFGWFVPWNASHAVTLRHTAHTCGGSFAASQN